MSQNRMMQRDRQIAEYDYQINRKAEREIEIIKNSLIELKKIKIVSSKDI